MSHDEVIQVREESTVLHITLNRPEQYNAMNAALLQGLPTILEQASNPRIRAVTIMGAGHAFCSGGDIAQFAGFIASQKVPRDMPENLHLAIRKIRALPKPVIALINGACAGAGFSLSLACDYSLATASAKFSLAYSGIGLAPDGGSTYFLPRILGFKQAMSLFLGGKALSAEEALQAGLVSEICADAEFANRSHELLARLANGPTAAYAKAKALVNQSYGNSLDKQLDLETDAICDSGFSPDFREGIMSFVEKRKPVFKGK